MSKNKIQDLLEKPMTRREFLRNVGLLGLGIVGLSGAINVLSSGSRNVIHKHIHVNQGRGFGAGRFGV